MTLVVGRICGPNVAIAGDTLITEHNAGLPAQAGSIKSCMLPGGLCVSFANSPETATRDIAGFREKFPRGGTFSDAVEFFERSSELTANDYLLAFAKPARLVKISNGKRLHSIAKTAWIGDRDAYSRFREYEARARPRPYEGRAVNAAMFMDEQENSPASNVHSALRDVVIDRSIETVGGFVSIISSRGSHFRYSVYSDMLYDWPEKYPFELIDKISLKTSEENTDFSVTQISPGFLNLNLVGFYLASGRKLYFFHGKGNGVANQCTVFSDILASQIADALTAFVGTDLKWLLTVAAPKSSPRYQGGEQSLGAQLAFLVEANTFPPSVRHSGRAKRDPESRGS
jgi:hypothetical protein